MSIRYPRALPLALVACFALALAGCTPRTDSAPVPGAGDGYLLCFWNVENLFDDRDDGRTGPDREYDRWFARDPVALQLKLDHLSDALIGLNGGRGPDILALAEVESLRAAELLRDTLNKRLADESLHYQHLLMKEVSAGRHIAPAILTRLPVKANRTQLHGHQQRILEGHISVNNHDLVIVACHWTSRVTDEYGDKRAKYGDQIYGLFKAMYRSNADVDLVVCGDFNDPPDAVSVTQHLHAVGDLGKVLQSGSDPLLFNVFAGKDAAAGFGTHFNQGKWYIFDQIAVSPALLKGAGGWICDVGSANTVSTLYRPGDRHKRPWRFGNPHDRFERGYSDHYPVTVRLKMEPLAASP
jgi:endonuclease/exonuclease/phosphatase family metal-dependent hydrolase